MHYAVLGVFTVQNYWFTLQLGTIPCSSGGLHCNWYCTMQYLGSPLCKAVYYTMQCWGFQLCKAGYCIMQYLGDPWYRAGYYTMQYWGFSLCSAGLIHGAAEHCTMQ